MFVRSIIGLVVTMGLTLMQCTIQTHDVIRKDPTVGSNTSVSKQHTTTIVHGTSEPQASKNQTQNTTAQNTTTQNTTTSQGITPQGTREKHNYLPCQLITGWFNVLLLYQAPFPSYG